MEGPAWGHTSGITPGSPPPPLGKSLSGCPSRHRTHRSRHGFRHRTQLVNTFTREHGCTFGLSFVLLDASPRVGGECSSPVHGAQWGWYNITMITKDPRPGGECSSTGTKSIPKVLTRKVGGTRDWRCPMHGRYVEAAPSFSRDEDTGRVHKNGGGYFRCPEYSECGYYVAPGSGIVPLVDDEGRALGRSLRERS